MYRTILLISFLFFMGTAFSQKTKEPYSDNLLVELLQNEKTLINSSLNTDSILKIFTLWEKDYIDKVSSSESFSIEKLNKFIYNDLNIKFDRSAFKLSNLFLERKGNCVTISILYLLLANQNINKFSIVKAPIHYFLRFYKDNDEYINIEPTKQGANYSDEYIIKQKKILNSSIQKGIYMVEIESKFLTSAYNANIAYILYMNSKFDEAIGIYSELIETDTLNPEAYFNRGLCFMGKGLLVESIKDFNQAINMVENIYVFYSARGDAYTKLGIKNNESSLFLKAIDSYTIALTLNENISELYLKRGNSYFNFGDYNSACADWIKASNMDNKEAKDNLTKFCK